MPDVDPAELRRLLAEATPGPWVRAGLFDNPRDAALSTASVNALPELLDDNARLTADNAALLARAEAAEAKVAEAREVALVASCLLTALRTATTGAMLDFAYSDENNEIADRLRALAGKEGE